MRAKARGPKPGGIALAGVPALNAADAVLSRAQCNRLLDALRSTLDRGESVGVAALDAFIALAAKTPRDDHEGAPPPVDCSDLTICDWCGQTCSGRAWGDAAGVFCSEGDAEAALEHAREREEEQEAQERRGRLMSVVTGPVLRYEETGEA
jgi:hypothetical protein